MRKIYKPNFEVINIDESNIDYDIVTTEGAKPNDLQARKLEGNALTFKVPKGLNLFDIEDPLFNLSLYLKKYTNNSIAEINREIEQNTAIKEMSVELVNGEYYIPLFTFFILKEAFSEEGQKRQSGLNYLRSEQPMIKLDGQNGAVLFSAGKVRFEADGSGQVANGNIVWDASGNLLVSGAFESNNNGNRVVIDPSTRSIKMISRQGFTIVNISFYDMMGEVGSDIRSYTHSEDGKVIGAIRVMGGRLMLHDGEIDVANQYMDIGCHNNKIDWYVRKDKMPKGRDNAYTDRIYLDGDTMKIR